MLIIKEGKMTFMIYALLLVGYEIDAYFKIWIYLAVDLALSVNITTWGRMLAGADLLWRNFCFISLLPVTFGLIWKRKKGRSKRTRHFCLRRGTYHGTVRGIVVVVLFLFGSLLLILETYRKTYKSKCWDTPAMRNWAEFQLSVTSAFAKKTILQSFVILLVFFLLF